MKRTSLEDNGSRFPLNVGKTRAPVDNRKTRPSVDERETDLFLDNRETRLSLSDGGKNYPALYIRGLQLYFQTEMARTT